MAIIHWDSSRDLMHLQWVVKGYTCYLRKIASTIGKPTYFCI